MTVSHEEIGSDKLIKIVEQANLSQDAVPQPYIQGAITPYLRNIFSKVTESVDALRLVLETQFIGLPI